METSNRKDIYYPPHALLKLTVENLRGVETTIISRDEKIVKFKSSRLDKFFKSINENLCVEVAIFSGSINISYWLNGNTVCSRSHYPRTLDNQLGTILFATYKNLESLFALRTHWTFETMDGDAIIYKEYNFEIFLEELSRDDNESIPIQENI